MLVNITEYFIESGREWQVGQNPDVPREVAARWIADGKANADTDGVRDSQSPVSGDAAPLAYDAFTDLMTSPPSVVFSSSVANVDANYRRLAIDEFRSSVQLAWNGAFGWYEPPTAGAVAFETSVSGDEILLYYKCAESTNDVFDVWVDNKRISAAPFKSTISTSTGSIYWMSISFGTRANRKIRIKCARVSALMLLVKKTAGVKKYVKNRKRVAFITDSFGDKSGELTSTLHAFPSVAAELLDCDVLQGAIGGSGFVAGTPFDNAGRVSACAAFVPDTIVFWSGINDTYSGTYQSRVLSTLQAYAAVCPASEIVTVATVPTDAVSTLSTNRQQVAAAIKSATDAMGGICIDGVGFLEAGGIPGTWSSTQVYPVGAFCIRRGAIWRRNLGDGKIGTYSEPGYWTHWTPLGYALTGTGSASVGVGPGPQGDGNRDFLLSGDNTHPTDMWAYELGIRIADDLRARRLA